jgi:GT2 family glycosyltransferase
MRSTLLALLEGVRDRLPNPRRRLTAGRVNQWKASRDEADQVYEHEPRVSFILQWFNQRGNVADVAARLPDAPEYETVVCEDGSIDGSLAAWDERLTRRNDFIVRSNDLHEIRSYTRAIGLARGEFVCLLQDDDDLPTDLEWVTGSLALFDAYPDLAVLCGQSAWGLHELDPDLDVDPPDAALDPTLESWLRGGDVEGFVDERPEEVPTVDPTTGRPLVFTPCISVGPVFVRTSVFEALDGFDLDFSEPGEPGMGFEVDFGLRCWEAGYRVGFTPMGLDRGAVGGTMTFSQQSRDEAHEEAWAKLRADHRDRFDEVTERVWRANAELAARE